MPGYLPTSDELSELVSLLNSHGVNYIVVGAHALAFHGVPRFTEDVDFFVSRSSQNIGRLANALEEFGITLPEESQVQMVSKERGVIFVGHRPNRVDFLNFLDGVDFDSAAESGAQGSLAGQPVLFISLKDYIAAKRASGRPKDISDLAILGTIIPGLDS